MNKGLHVEGINTQKYKEFDSRRDIERYVKSMKQFLDRNADFKVSNNNGASMQYSEIQEIEKRVISVNKQKKKQWNMVKDQQYKHNGHATNLTVEQQADPSFGIGDPHYAVFKPVELNYQRFRSEKEFRDWAQEKKQVWTNDYMKRVNEMYKESYLKALENVFSDLGDEYTKLRKHINDMPMSEFINRYYTENLADIDFVYDKIEARKKLKQLHKTWEIPEEEK